MSTISVMVVLWRFGSGWGLASFRPSGNAALTAAGHALTAAHRSSHAARRKPLDGVAVITLNRPEAMNALSKALRAALQTAIEELDADPR